MSSGDLIWRKVEISPFYINFSILRGLKVNLVEVPELNIFFLKDLKVGWVRHEFMPDSLDIQHEMVSFLRENGIEILGVISVGSMRNESFDLKGWMKAVRFFVEEFPEVKVWEIWNECNNFRLGYQNFTAEHYVNMLLSAQCIIKEYRPRARICFAGFTPYEENIPFFEECWKLGASDYCDLVGFHVYLSGYSKEETRKSLLKVKRIMGLRKRKILWITEFGQTSLGVGEVYQAKMLREMYDFLNRCKFLFGTTKLFWHDYIDRAPPLVSPDSEKYYGLLRQDQTPKQAYYEYRDITRRIVNFI